MTNNKETKEGAYAALTGFRRAVPIILVALAVFTGLCFIMQDTGALGSAISNVFLGLFSVGGYFIPALLAIHAFFYPSDVQRKRTITRFIFSAIAVITIAALAHSITYLGADLVFAPKEFYKSGTGAKGGGFIGGIVAFGLTKIFGTVGLIIIAVLIFALYLTYFFAGGKTTFLRALLKILTAISNFFTFLGIKIKERKEKNAALKEERLREELAEQQDPLFDDEFFAADNGMKELTITKLGVKEIRDDKEFEKNPNLQDKVHHKSGSFTSEPLNEEVYDEPTKDSAPREKRQRRVNMDYSTTDSVHGLSVSVNEASYEPRNNDIIYEMPKEEPIPKDSESAEDVFGGNFNPYDFKLNEELANKPSSKTAKERPEPEGISEFAEPLVELDENEIDKARQRADFEMKKRAALDAQRRYAEAQAEIEKNKAENEAQNKINTENNESETNAQDEREPYIPDYMAEIIKEAVAETVNENVARESAERKAEEENRARREATFASAMSHYETERFNTEFRPYTPPTEEDIPKTEEKIYENPLDNELKISRSMLDPSPASEEYIPEEPAEETEAEPTLDFEDSKTEMEFDFLPDEDAETEIPYATNENSSAEISFSYGETDTAEEEPENEPEEPELFGIADISEDEVYIDEKEIPEEEIFSSTEEIPLEEQNPEVKELRKLFPFLEDTENSADSDEDSITQPSIEGESSNNDESENISEDMSDNEDEEKEDKVKSVPFEQSPLARFVTPKAPAPKPEPEPAPVQEKPDYSDYQFPPLDLLVKGKEEEDLNQEEEKNQNAEKLVDALLQFNVRISIKGIDRGPRITRYEIVPARGVKVQAVTNLFNDIALNLGAEGIRMEAPIPGKSAIGVEIPNKKPSTVLLRDLVESDQFICAESKTMSCLGKDVTGNPVFADIARMPHVLVAGATGMGKSVCINSILISILYKAKPDEVKFIMIDPKKVEFNGYNGIPHLLVPVVTDVKQAAGALMWAVEQMEKRYDLMEALEVRKLDAYNEKVRENPELGEPLPKIVIVIDELNDIMLQVRKPAEDLIMSIAQKARAAGIHLIIGTQRPSVDVITGVIKANIPSRISCKVASYNDSKTILEQAGAEKLLNNGDMLYIPAGAPKALRVQGAFVSDGEVAAIMKFLKSQAKGNVYDAQALEDINRAAQKCSKGKGGGDDYGDDDDRDDDDNAGILNDQQFLDAVELAVKSGKISTSLIQRKISIGYGKAAKFIDYMEDMGIVSEPNGQKPRDVLVTKDEWHEMLSRRSLD